MTAAYLYPKKVQHLIMSEPGRILPPSRESLFFSLNLFHENSSLFAYPKNNAASKGPYRKK